MRLKPVSYKIVTGTTWSWVDGIAVDHPALPVKFAVQHSSPGWRATHWDSGYSVGRYHQDMDECIESAIQQLEQTLLSGALAKALEASRPVINVPMPTVRPVIARVPDTENVWAARGPSTIGIKRNPKDQGAAVSAALTRKRAAGEGMAPKGNGKRQIVIRNQQDADKTGKIRGRA